MKQTKQSALYTINPPPPLLWVYKCSTCNHYIPNNDCNIVCRKGLPDLNIINPNSWCILWQNKQNDTPLSWVQKK